MFWNSGTVHNLDESHDGQTLKVKPGDSILLKLPHSSVDKWGFEWPCDMSNSPTVAYYGESTPESGYQQLEFEAGAAGTEQIKLERKQTPGNGNAVIKNFTINIEVESDDDADDDGDGW